MTNKEDLEKAFNAGWQASVESPRLTREEAFTSWFMLDGYSISEMVRADYAEIEERILAHYAEYPNPSKIITFKLSDMTVTLDKTNKAETFTSMYGTGTGRKK